MFMLKRKDRREKRVRVGLGLGLFGRERGSKSHLVGPVHEMKPP
jgi:hypothetical protein